MSNIIGYARVSTLEQNAALQVDALTAAGAVRVFTDYASGATDDRPALREALAYLNAGGTFVVWRIDRLGRSVANLIETVNGLAARQVQFRSVTDAIDTSTAGGEFTFHIFAAFAQMERRLISERTLAGLQSARARGRTGGRPTVMTPARLAEAHRMREGGQTLEYIASTLGVGRATVVRALRQPAPPIEQPLWTS